MINLLCERYDSFFKSDIASKYTRGFLMKIDCERLSRGKDHVIFPRVFSQITDKKQRCIEINVVHSFCTSTDINGLFIHYILYIFCGASSDDGV